MSSDNVHPNNKSSLIPSVGASIATSSILYPLDYLKTMYQLNYGSTKIIQLPKETKYLFSGLSSVNVSIFFKTFARFQTFDYFNALFADKNLTQTSGSANPGVLVSSLFAGISESLVIVPFENIKVNLIESTFHNANPSQNPLHLPFKPQSLQATVLNSKKNDPLNVSPSLHRKKVLTASYSKNFLQAARYVYQNHGVYGFFKGTNMTLIRQCASSAGFFTTYSSLKQLMDPNNSSSSRFLDAFLTIGSAFVIVGLTQPIDMIKTRFQSVVYSKELKYRNSLQCAFQIYATEGGFAKLYAGAVPRLVRTSINGSVMIVFYEFFHNFYIASQNAMYHH